MRRSTRRLLVRWCSGLPLALVVCLLAAPASAGWIQGAAGAREAGSRAHDAHQAAPVSGPDARGQAAHSAPERHGETGAHAESPWATVARLVNFGVLVGVLVYFLRAPVARYFAGRREAIAGALAAAAADRQRADALLAEVEARRRALPGEIEALRARAAAEIAAEEARLQQGLEAERRRLLDQMRRELELRARIARRELVAEAADLVVRAALDRIRRAITIDDQLRLVDRYAALVGSGVR